MADSTPICNLLQIGVALCAGYRGPESDWPRRGTRVTRTRLVMSAAICVVAVALATVGLPRRGEVAGSSHTPDVRVLGAVGLLMLLGSIFLITFGPKRGAGGPGKRAVWPYLVGQAVFLLVLYFALRDSHFVTAIFKGLHQPSSQTGHGTTAPTLGTPDLSLWPVLVAIAVLVGLLALWWMTRRALVEDLPVDEDDVDPGAVAAAATAGLSAIQATSAGREAVISCYEAMASSVGRRGVRLRLVDTPTELLERAVAAGVLNPGPPDELIDLFQIARYSRQPLPDDAVPRAVAALRLIQADVASALGAHP
jgi:hypothetical protein